MEFPKKPNLEEGEKPWEIKFSERQSLAWNGLEDPQVIALLYGGAKGGGKSVFGCYWMYLKCLELIKKFRIEKRKFPYPVGFMGRKQSVDFNDTTLETWKSVIPEKYYELKASEKEIIIGKAVKIQYGGFDDKDTVKKFNSAEYAFAFVDQAEEISRDDYGLLRGTLRRQILNKELEYKILLTANPAICWLKDDFIVRKAPRCEFVQALPTDNPFLVGGYVENLKEAFKHRPELVAAYVDGNWDIMAGGNLVFRPSWVREAIGKQLPFDDTRTVVACDPARFGDDETVIYVLRGRAIIDRMIYGQKSTMETAGNLVMLKNKHKARYIAVDSIGIGAGIVDRLNELHEPCLSINMAEAPTILDAQYRYTNLRAQILWEASERFAAGEVHLHPDDTDLINQLGVIQYEFGSNGKLKIEDKSKIKERMSGRSPDRADAFCIGLHAIEKVVDPVHDFRRSRAAVLPLRKGDGYGWAQREIFNAR